jgi:hypothetical protein
VVSQRRILAIDAFRARTIKNEAIYSPRRCLKDARQIAGAVQHAGHFDASIGREVKDEVIANPIAAEIHREFRTGLAPVRCGRETLALGTELVDELVGGVRIIAAM